MHSLYKSFKNRYTTLTCFALVVLQSRLEILNNIFSNHKLTRVNYDCGDGSEVINVVEISLDGATLTCVMDENDVCEMSYLFMDEIDEFEKHVKHCHESYPYNQYLNAWFVSDSYITVGVMDDIKILVFSPKIKIEK